MKKSVRNFLMLVFVFLFSFNSILLCVDDTVYGANDKSVGLIIIADLKSGQKLQKLNPKSSKDKIAVLHSMVSPQSYNTYSVYKTLDNVRKCKNVYVIFVPRLEYHPIPEEGKPDLLATTVATWCNFLKADNVKGYYCFDLDIPKASGAIEKRIQENVKNYNKGLSKSIKTKVNNKDISVKVLNQGDYNKINNDETYCNDIIGKIETKVTTLENKFKFDKNANNSVSIGSSATTGSSPTTGSSSTTGSSGTNTENGTTTNDNNAYQTSNDGKVKDKEHIFGDSGAPGRYIMDGAEYYDVAVPYDTTVKEIGGYATSATGSQYSFSGSKTDWNNKQNALFGKEGTVAYGINKISTYYDTFSYDDNVGGLAYIMIGNIKCYCSAIGQGLYANSAWGMKIDTDGAPNWGKISDLLNKGTPVNSGLFFDLLLKDGTQVHFVASDFINTVHSIGGADKKGGKDDVIYTHSKINYPQYTAMWHCDNPWHMLELVQKEKSSPTDVRKALNITEENPVMYIRVWKASLFKSGKDGVKVVSGMEDGINKGNALSTASSGTTGEEVSNQYMKGYYDEKELSAWSKIINEYYINYKEVNRDALSQSDLSSLNTWETNVKYDELENHGIFNFFRKLFVGIGILMLLYSGILYCCYWLDRINPFYDIDFLDFATIGKLATAPTEEECNFHVKDFFKDNKDKAKYVNHKAIITICLGLIIFGLMIITGSIYKIVIGIIGLVGDLLNIE